MDTPSCSTVVEPHELLIIASPTDWLHSNELPRRLRVLIKSSWQALTRIQVARVRVQIYHNRVDEQLLTLGIEGWVSTRHAKTLPGESSLQTSPLGRFAALVVRCDQNHIVIVLIIILARFRRRCLSLVVLLHSLAPHYGSPVHLLLLEHGSRFLEAV